MNRGPCRGSEARQQKSLPERLPIPNDSVLLGAPAALHGPDHAGPGHEAAG